MKHVFLLALLFLCACSNSSGSSIDNSASSPTVSDGASLPGADNSAHPKQLGGAYVSQAASGKTFLHLSVDGKGAFLSKNQNGSFNQIMTFDWSVKGNEFFMSNTYFSTDLKKIYKTQDSRIEYKVVGSTILSLAQDGSGNWIEWKQTGNTPDMTLINLIVKK
jgi:hypothetical protein